MHSLVLMNHAFGIIFKISGISSNKAAGPVYYRRGCAVSGWAGPKDAGGYAKEEPQRSHRHPRQVDRSREEHPHLFPREHRGSHS